MTITVDPLEITATPIVVTASAAPAALTINVTEPSPTVVEVGPITMTAAVIEVPVDVAVAVIGQRGPKGDQGDTGSGAVVQGEVPIGVVDGINDTFTAAGAFQSVAVYLNGLRERYFTEVDSSTIQFDTPPLVGDLITIDYVIA